MATAEFGLALRRGGAAWERNGVWRHFTGAGTYVRYTPEGRRAHEKGLVGSLRETSVRYPADPGLQSLIAQLRAHSTRFAELRDAGAAGRRDSNCKIIDYPQVGALELDCEPHRRGQRPANHDLRGRARHRRSRPPGPAVRPRHPFIRRSTR